MKVFDVLEIISSIVFLENNSCEGKGCSFPKRCFRGVGSEKNSIYSRELV